MLDERSSSRPTASGPLSRVHQDHPYVLDVGGREHRVGLRAGRVVHGLFGGNSNWRGPVWFPVNYLLIESLQKFHHFLGDSFTVEFPPGSGKQATLWEVAAELSRRLTRIFLRDERGRRPVFGGTETFQTRSALARLRPLPRVLPRRQRRGTRREPPDRVDRPRRQAASAERRVTAGDGEPDGREWLETNGLGGYALSTVTGENTRRYHGLLVAATKPPVGRAVLLSKLEETLVLNGRRIGLSTNRFPGVTHPEGFRLVSAFRKDPFPTLRWEVDGVVLEKEIFMPHGRTAVCVTWRLLKTRQRRRADRPRGAAPRRVPRLPCA